MCFTTRSASELSFTATSIVAPVRARTWTCLQAELEKAYELKTQRISNRNSCTTEGKVLNRIVRWTKEGYELEETPDMPSRLLNNSSLDTLRRSAVLELTALILRKTTQETSS